LYLVVEQRTKKQTQNCNKKIPWRGRYPSLSRKTKVEEAKAAPTYIARAHADEWIKEHGHWRV